MGANIRELRDRVGSVKNTKKITSAMKLVAAAKERGRREGRHRRLCLRRLYLFRLLLRHGA